MHDFKLWAPRAEKMSLKFGDQVLPMQGPDERGVWHLRVDDAGCGSDYAFLIEDDQTPYPDPRSLRQPGGVHGPSRLYDHSQFQWTDDRWRAPELASGVLYEMHIGTFSDEGTFDGAIPHLDHLVETGVTHIEIMPVAEYAGERGWGYDGVALFAVHEPYGGPDGLKRLVNACHEKKLAVVLDVVYNHFGPVGNYTNKFGPYLTERYGTPWGAAVNFAEGGSDEVRQFFIDNAIMFLRDYHVDGLRLDAVHEFIDRSAVNFMEQLSADVERLGTTLGRNLFLIAESDLNDPKIVRSREAGGYGMDAQWSDDFHHALFTLLYNNQQEQGYYSDFGRIEMLAKSLQQAFVYTGQYSGYRKHKHGRPIGNTSAYRFIGFSQNHDQVGNRAKGERLEHLVGMDGAKVGVGLTLMSPFVPMLFMGEEFAASAPFLYFADHEEEEMRRLVSEGRKKDFALFGFGEADVPDPEAVETFNDSKLNWSEVHQGKHLEMFEWVKGCIKLRRCIVSLNDGDFGHVDIRTHKRAKALDIRRGDARILVNLGDKPYTFECEGTEELKLASNTGIALASDQVTLPPTTMAVLLPPEPDRVG